MNVMVQRAGQPLQSLLFHPWQSSVPDANITNVNATTIITTGGITDNAILAHSSYSLFTTNSSDQGISHACCPQTFGWPHAVLHCL